MGELDVEADPGLGPCIHPRTVPIFDKEAAKGLDSWQVRERWPRFNGPCPDCGSRVIGYASFEHYLAGDW